ncbi:MAG: ribonuclease III [Phycisphaerales bacterium]|nr:ribonuclease III [Phycisphaerales bacterium]
MGQPDIEAIEALIGHRFADRELLRVAVRHASVADTRAVSNERMEFLGDAVLGLVTCERVYQLYPEMLEGEMTKIKSKVVSRETCAQLAIALGLHLHLQLGKGMRSAGATVPMSLAAAALESVIAALYLDAGMDKTRAFIVPLVEPMIREAEASKHQENYKSLLQHHAQQGAGNSPQYIVIEERGPDHSKHFLIAARVGDTQFDAAWGASKKIAEQAAAERALRTLGVLGDGVGA